MKRAVFAFVLLILPVCLAAQTNEWMTQYVTLDDATSGTGNRTVSVAAVGANAFVALVSRPEDTADLFGAFNNNYLVGYMNADSANGRVADQPYSPTGQLEVWADASTGLDQVTFNGAWQLASGANNYVYVANNDITHNILVFELTATGVVGTDFRMETGSENIFAIDVDNAGFVYVVDYQGSDAKTDEVKVYAPIGSANTTWGDFGGHNDAPVATIDLPPGRYMGVTVSGDGSAVFVSAVDSKSIMKFTGDPGSGYTEDMGFLAAIAPDDIVLDVDGLLVGSTAFLGLSYLDDPGLLFAAVDTFLCRGVAVESGCGGYNTGRIFVIDPLDGAGVDTIDVAQWNIDVVGIPDGGSSNGRAGGFASVYDVDVTNEPAVYSQTYYGWAVEKWVFDGDITVVSVEQISERIPESFSLGQNYPNPFNPGTTIAFDLKSAQHVTLAIYNMLGQKVATVLNERMTPGTYEVAFDASRLPTGIYYYTLRAGAFKTTKKMTLIK